MQGKEGFAFAGEGEIGVVLDTHITDELKEEGTLREILSKVQNLRKERNFEVLNKIILYVSGNEKIEEIIKKYEDEVKHETLTLEVKYNENRDSYVDTNINGEHVNFDVLVVE